MNKPASVMLPEHLHAFVEAQVAAGHYGSMGEAIQAAVRLLEEQESKLQALRSALIEGENSGPGKPFDEDAFLAEMRGA